MSGTSTHKARAFAAVLMILAWGCSPEPEKSAPAIPGESAPLSVYVVNYPLAYFAERIGGEHAAVVLPVPADVDPADWTPDADTVAVYQGADLILLNGGGYAGWVERASLPRAKLVDTSRAFQDRLVVLEKAPTHGHGPEGMHSHQETAFTTWLDPSLAIE